MAKKGRDAIELELANYYADYVRNKKQEPDVAGLNQYLEEIGAENHLAKKDWSKIRELAFAENEDLQDLALNESYFTDEYFEKLDEVLRTKKQLNSTSYNRYLTGLKTMMVLY